jgi:CBS domain-containing protein
MGEAIRVRIYCDGHDRRGGESLVHAVVHLLWREHAAGVTVVRATEGFGVNRHLHAGRVEILGSHLPVLIEWLDTPDRHARIWPRLEPLVAGVLVTRESVEVLAWPAHGLRSLDLTATVDEVMHRDVVAVATDAPLAEVVDLMVGRGLRFVPVLDGGQLAGVITNGDLVARAGLGAGVQLGQAPDPGAAAQWAGRTAREVMTAEPTAVLTGTRITDAAQLMLSRRVKRLPVLHQGQVVGVISRLDVLKTVADDLANGGGAAALAGPINQIGQLAVGPVPAVVADADLPQVLDVVASTRLNHAVVIDADGHVLGLVSDTELLRRVGLAHRGVVDRLMRRNAAVAPSGHMAADLMTPAPLVVPASLPIGQAIASMMDAQAKVLPVVDDQERLVGIVDRADVLRAVFGGPTGPAPTGQD